MDNNELLQSLSAYKKILGFSYHFVIGRKNKTVDINLSFSKKDFFHLSGLQYLNDIRELNNDREKIFNKIERDTEFLNLILSSVNYFKIKERISLIENLESFLDSNKTIFKFNNRTNLFSLIDADYILKNSDTTKNMYVFISKDSTAADTYFCRSAFSRNKSEKDYAVGHTSYTLLYKEKIDLITNERQVLYTHPSYEKQQSSRSQPPQTDNIKQIKFDNPTPQNILHNNLGAAAAVLPAPNPFKNLIDRLKNILKKQDKHVETVAPVQTVEQPEITEKEIKVEEKSVPPKLAELIEAREAFAENKIAFKEYQQALANYIYSFTGKEMWTEAIEVLKNQLKECPDNLKKPINYEIDNIERNFKKRFAPKPPERIQTLEEIKRAAHEQYIKMRNEKAKSEKEEITVNNNFER